MALLQSWPLDRNETTGGAGVEAVAAMGDRAVVPLARLTESGDLRTAREAVFVLAKVGTETAVAAIARIVDLGAQVDTPWPWRIAEWERNQERSSAAFNALREMGEVRDATEVLVQPSIIQARVTERYPHSPSTRRPPTRSLDLVLT